MVTTDTSVIPTEFVFSWNETVIEIKMKMTPIISFSIDTIGMSNILVIILKFIFSLINLMAFISYINMWLWQWLKFIYVLSTMVIESMMGLMFIYFVYDAYTVIQ